MSEQKPEGKLTSADIKKQIEQAKEEMKNSGKPLTGQLANEINASESTPKETPKAEVKPEPRNGAANGTENPKPTEEVDLKEWAKKKGIDWTTEDTVLSALRKSDEQFHRKRQEEKSREQAQPPYMATPPPYQPTYSQNYHPAYQPPPVNNRVVLENLARQYNMPTEDVERLMAFNKDFFEAASRQDRERYEKEMSSIKRENQKNSVFRELSSDPVFRRPEVGQEFSRVLEEMQKSDPQSFEQDPNAYMRAYDRTLVNIARRNLEGQPLVEGSSPTPRLPTNPPKPFGQGSGGGAAEKMEFDREAFFNLKTPEEKKAYLNKMGLVSTY